jgi:RNA polymerase sigma-70 factor (ECF subfamily)
MVATLTRIFGVANLALVEDVVQDALCRALETWKIRGVPDDPAAWLMATAKNRALDFLRRERTARTFAPEVAWHVESEQAIRTRIEENSAGATITNDQLRMMFSCCNPRLTEASTRRRRRQRRELGAPARRVRRPACRRRCSVMA